MDYITLSPQDRVTIAKDVLRGKESDYFRFTLMDPTSYGGPERLEALEGEIGKIHKEVGALEKAAAKA